MRPVPRVWVLLTCAAALGAQTPPPEAAQLARPAGLETEWDIAVILGAIGAHADRMAPELDRLDAKLWLAKGASATYAEQLESCRQQNRAIALDAKALAKNPEKLAESLKLLFRIDGLDSILASVGEAMRKYQSVSDAEALAGQAAENGTNRERLRQYVVTLAAERERQFEVMDREAQRCRGIMAAQPPPAPARTPGRKK